MTDTIAAAVAAKKPSIPVMSIAFKALYSVLSTATVFPFLLIIPEGDISSSLLRSSFNLRRDINVITARMK